MKEKLLAKMAEIVAATMTAHQTDYTTYDTNAITDAKPTEFPMLWVVGELHTHLLRLASYANKFPSDERLQLDYVQNGMPYQWYLANCKRDKWFLLTKEGDVTEITCSQANEIIRDVVLPVVNEFQRSNKLPDAKVPVHFVDLTIGQLKQLLTRDAHYTAGTLRKLLKRFQRRYKVAKDQYIEVRLIDSNDLAWAEYYDGQFRIWGHLINHGSPETGYMKNNSFQIDPHYGWSSHT